jgi:RNA polymerase sigma-70 factor, ECF subfamily
MAATIQITPEQVARLTQLAQQGRSEAFARLLETHETLVLRVARQQLCGREGYQDVAQEAMLRACQRLQTLRQPAQFTAWLLGIVINVAREHRRAPHLRWLPLPVAELFAADDPPAETPADEYRALHRAMTRLPATYQTVLALRYLEDMSYEEAAHRLGLTPAGVRTRVHRARLLLAKALRRAGVVRG